MSSREISDALHARVVAFGLDALDGRATGDTFEALATDIAAFQYEHSEGFRRLVDARGRGLADVASIPAVPTDAFRLSRVATHPLALDAVRFETSGTTGDATGVHPMRRTTTYRTLSRAFGERALVEDPNATRIVTALCPDPGVVVVSSLAFMIMEFMREWDGRALDGGPDFDPHEPGRWLAGAQGVDVAGFERVVDIAASRGVSLLVATTGFALVLLLDALSGRRLALPANSSVMLTGGFKGRTREVDPTTLVAEAARTFCIDGRRIVGEYGMTELSSQLYEGILPGGRLDGPRGVFVPPPWVRAVPVDPVTLSPTASGEPGLARFVDLANVDSALAVLTQDWIRIAEPGVELLGRQVGAPPRGCSLALEQMVL